MTRPGDGFGGLVRYSTRDDAAVERVARNLTERGIRVFLDRWYLTPAQPWPQALEQTLAACNTVAVFIGTDGLDPWQQRERDLALDRQGREHGFPMIPVLLSRADPALGFLKLNTWVDLSAGDADESDRDPGGRHLPAAAGAARPATDRSRPRRDLPLPRLAPVPRGGRAVLLRPRRVHRDAGSDARPPAVRRRRRCVRQRQVVGGARRPDPSPAPRRGRVRLGCHHPRPHRSAAASLAEALLPLLEPDLSEVDRLAEVNKLAAHLADGSVALRDVIACVLQKQQGTDRLLLFVDQWEELYTLCCPDDDTRRAFIVQLLEAAAASPVRVVLTMRGDFFGRALADRALSDELQDAVVNIGPMTHDELAETITRPAEKAGLGFEPGLVETILDDVGDEPGGLPLLEFLLKGYGRSGAGTSCRTGKETAQEGD